MPSRKQYRIGEFARLSGTPIKTLRFYDELGLLTPSEVDVRTRYRYYDAAQLQDVAAIRALKELGASLEDIRLVIRRSDDDRARRKLLTRLRASALRTLTAARRSLDWIDLELEDAGHGHDKAPVFLHQRGGVRIASIRARLNSYDDITPVEHALARAVHPRLTGDLRGVLWHRCEASGAIEGEPFVEVCGRASGIAGYTLSDLPSARVASAFCESDDDAAVRTYETIDRWIHRHSLQLDGPKREIQVGQILEIQFPVRPV